MIMYGDREIIIRIDTRANAQYPDARDCTVTFWEREEGKPDKPFLPDLFFIVGVLENVKKTLLDGSSRAQISKLTNGEN